MPEQGVDLVCLRGVWVFELPSGGVGRLRHVDVLGGFGLKPVGHFSKPLPLLDLLDGR